jgi:1-acyl-sn-glycerol-3-phosphate acyltransferase
MIQSAIAANSKVQPVAIRYIDSASGEQSFAPSFIGDDTLLQSVWRTLRAKPMTAVLVFGEPELAAGRDRRTWANDLRTTIHTMLS